MHAVGELCDAKIEGLALRSQMITFEPKRLRAGEYRFNIGTAGSITLVLQALLPVLLVMPASCKAYITGGTDVRQAPPADYLCEVLIRLIKRLGAQVEMRILRRGYYPQGGGEIEVVVKPAQLTPAAFSAFEHIQAIRGIVHVTNLPDHIAIRMKQAALDQLGIYSTQARIETQTLSREAAFGPGGAIVSWAESEHTVLGSARVAELGVRAEALGEAVGEELAADLTSGAALDVHAADQMLVYFALAGGGSFSTRDISLHARTAIWLIAQFLPITIDFSEAAGLTHVTVTPRRQQRS